MHYQRIKLPVKKQYIPVRGLKPDHIWVLRTWPCPFGKKDRSRAILIGCTWRVGYCGTLRSQAFFWLRAFSAPRQSPRPPTRGECKSLGACPTIIQTEEKNYAIQRKKRNRIHKCFFASQQPDPFAGSAAFRPTCLLCSPDRRKYWRVQNLETQAFSK